MEAIKSVKDGNKRGRRGQLWGKVLEISLTPHLLPLYNNRGEKSHQLFHHVFNANVQTQDKHNESSMEKHANSNKDPEKGYFHFSSYMFQHVFSCSSLFREYF